MPRRPSLSERLDTEALGRRAFLPGTPEGRSETDRNMPTAPSTAASQSAADDASAVSGPPSTVDEQPVTVNRRRVTNIVAPAQRWEAQHTRVTFYCPVELLERIEAEIVESGRSKTAVIVDALRADLSGR